MKKLETLFNTIIIVCAVAVCGFAVATVVIGFMFGAIGTNGFALLLRLAMAIGIELVLSCIHDAILPEIQEFCELWQSRRG